MYGNQNNNKIDEIERIGYYAKCRVTGNLYLFTWTKEDKFLIKVDSDTYIQKESKDYIILEVGFFKG